MRAMAVRSVVAAAVAAVVATAMGTVIAASAEDDLAVVKRAVRQEASPTPRVDDEKDSWESRNDARPRTGGRELRWFKVRITEKGTKRARVNVNLPIALVRALGDDFPIDIGRHARRDRWRGDRRDGRSEKVIRLGEILATLEAGQPLVEIDDDDATVRVWVE